MNASAVTRLICRQDIALYLLLTYNSVYAPALVCCTVFHSAELLPLGFHAMTATLGFSFKHTCPATTCSCADYVSVIQTQGSEWLRGMQAVQQEQCTALYGVPTMFIAQLALPDFACYDLSSLRKGIMAGSPCPQDTMQQVIYAPHLVPNQFALQGVAATCVNL